MLAYLLSISHYLGTRFAQSRIPHDFTQNKGYQILSHQLAYQNLGIRKIAHWVFCSEVREKDYDIYTQPFNYAATKKKIGGCELNKIG